MSVIGVLATKGSAFGQSQDDICVMPITRFFENFGSAKRTVNIATQSFSTDTYNRTLDKGIGAMRIARGLKPNQPDDFEIYSNDSLKSAFASIAGVVRDSAAERLGIQTGDLVTRINGEAVAKWDFRRYEQLLASADEITFTFLTGPHESEQSLHVFALVP